MTFQVGDVVEVVKVYRNPHRVKMLGAQLIITGAYTGRSPMFPELHTRYTTAPPPPAPAEGWHPSALRKIEPPDWQAPRVRETEAV